MIFKRGIFSNELEKSAEEDETSWTFERHFRELETTPSVEFGRDIRRYVKPMKLDQYSNFDKILKELKVSNIVILDIKALLRNVALKRLLMRDISELKRIVADIDGDLARISEEKILVVPRGVKIVSK